MVSALIPWTGPGYVAEVHPRDVAFLALLDPNRPETAPSLGLVLLGAGLLGALVALLTMVAPILKFLRRIIGLLTLAVVGFFVFRLVQELLEVGEVGNILSALGIGAYTAAAGAFTQMVAGKWFRH
jgi:tetrahydromethanopterin S-methyltransferase subunit C